MLSNDATTVEIQTAAGPVSIPIAEMATLSNAMTEVYFVKPDMTLQYPLLEFIPKLVKKQLEGRERGGSSALKWAHHQLITLMQMHTFRASSATLKVNPTNLQPQPCQYPALVHLLEASKIGPLSLLPHIEESLCKELELSFRTWGFQERLSPLGTGRYEPDSPGEPTSIRMENKPARPPRPDPNTYTQICISNLKFFSYNEGRYIIGQVIDVPDVITSFLWCSLECCCSQCRSESTKGRCRIKIFLPYAHEVVRSNTILRVADPYWSIDIDGRSLILMEFSYDLDVVQLIGNEYVSTTTGRCLVAPKQTLLQYKEAGNEEFSQEDLATALQHFSCGLRFCEESIWASKIFGCLARCFLHLGEDRLALATSAAALYSTPNCESALMSYTRALVRLGNWIPASEMCVRLQQRGLFEKAMAEDEGNNLLVPQHVKDSISKNPTVGEETNGALSESKTDDRETWNVLRQGYLDNLRTPSQSSTSLPPQDIHSTSAIMQQFPSLPINASMTERMLEIKKSVIRKQVALAIGAKAQGKKIHQAPPITGDSAVRNVKTEADEFYAKGQYKEAAEVYRHLLLFVAEVGHCFNNASQCFLECRMWEQSIACSIAANFFYPEEVNLKALRRYIVACGHLGIEVSNTKEYLKQVDDAELRLILLQIKKERKGDFNFTELWHNQKPFIADYVHPSLLVEYIDDQYRRGLVSTQSMPAGQTLIVNHSIGSGFSSEEPFQVKDYFEKWFLNWNVKMCLMDTKTRLDYDPLIYNAVIFQQSGVDTVMTDVPTIPEILGRSNILLPFYHDQVNVCKVPMDLSHLIGVIVRNSFAKTQVRAIDAPDLSLFGTLAFMNSGVWVNAVQYHCGRATYVRLTYPVKAGEQIFIDYVDEARYVAMDQPLVDWGISNLQRAPIWKEVRACQTLTEQVALISRVVAEAGETEGRIVANFLLEIAFKKFASQTESEIANRRQRAEKIMEILKKKQIRKFPAVTVCVWMPCVAAMMLSTFPFTGEELKKACLVCFGVEENQYFQTSKRAVL